MTDPIRKAWEAGRDAAADVADRWYRNIGKGNPADEIRALIEPARETAGVTVKPLEWDDDPNGGWSQSETGAGWEYLIRNMEDYFVMPFPWKPPERFPTIEAAKAAAQADYERRIISALTTAPVSTAEAARVFEADLAALPDGDWEVWTSCSFRRITAKGGPDGGALHALKQRSDGHPDLSWTADQCQAICNIVNGLRRSLSEQKP